MTLPNETKIKFCNAYRALDIHSNRCRACMSYTFFGEGDLCDAGKQIILMEMAYADTSPELPDFPGELKERIPNAKPE